MRQVWLMKHDKCELVEFVCTKVSCSLSCLSASCLIIYLQWWSNWDENSISCHWMLWEQWAKKTLHKLIGFWVRRENSTKMNHAGVSFRFLFIEQLASHVNRVSMSQRGQKRNGSLEEIKVTLYLSREKENKIEKRPKERKRRKKW